MLAAELRKIIRPLVWGTALAIVAFRFLITWGTTHNAHAALASPRIPDVCAHAAIVPAVAAPLIAASAHLPAAHTGLFAGSGSSLTSAGRAVIVVGLFARPGAMAARARYLATGYGCATASNTAPAASSNSG